MVLETARLRLRDMVGADAPALCRVLQDPIAMAAYEHAFTDEEVALWLQNQQRRYREDGFGLWVVQRQDTGALCGQCGLTWQEAHGERVLEIGYLFERAVWGQGFATEAAIACKRYAFDVLGAREVCSIIRQSNVASQRVALRCGMTARSTLTRHYYGIDMPHLVFTLTQQEDAARAK